MLQLYKASIDRSASVAGLITFPFYNILSFNTLQLRVEYFCIGFCSAKTWSGTQEQALLVTNDHFKSYIPHSILCI